MCRRRITVSRSFTLVELLVVVSIIAVLAAILLPSLSAARERGMRSSCSNNLRQLSTMVHLYADDDSNGYFPIHGYNGLVPHIMEDRMRLTKEYLNNDHRSFFCPSSSGLWADPCLSWSIMTAGKGGQGGQYFGYGYFGGVGDSDPTYINTNYYAYRWGGISTWQGKALTPSVSQSEALHGQPPDVRPMFSDNAFNYGTTILLGLSQGRSAPAHNHVRGDLGYSVFENIVFLDGHLEGIANPYLRPARGPWGMHF